MDKIRLGNDIEMRWSIFTRDGDNKVPYNLEGRALTLSVVNRTGESEIEFFTEGNIVTGVFRGRDQRILGKHGVILRENNGKDGMRTIDACDAFELVACSCEEALGSSGTIQLFHLTFDSTIGAITGTIDPILNYEAEQAEAERKANEVIRKANEGQRIDNEKQRNVNEILRNIAEEERKNAEQERRVNEDLRKADEAERKTNEESRLRSESERISSEEERLYAESIRVANENARIASEAKRAEAETARIEAEDKRIVSEKNRLSAESSRIANEDSRRANEDSRLSAEAERVSAEANRVSAESERVSAESERVSNEKERQIAEEERQAKFASMVVQSTGDATDKVMSQKAVTEALKGKQNKLTAGNGISIEGNVISSSVAEVVDKIVNAGYVFAGVATPSTAPGTPEAKVFYIANGKGTYTNFGGLEVTEDEVVVLKYDTAWHKVATGVASQEKLSELSAEINEKITTLYSEDYLEVVTDSEGKIIEAIKPDGTKVFNAGIENGYTEKPEARPDYLEVVTDSEGKIIEAIKPDGTKYIPKLETPILKQISNILYGKKYVAVGDSFTEGSYTGDDVSKHLFTEGLYKGKNRVYPYYIGNRNYMEVINMAVSGSCITTISDLVNEWPSVSFSYQAYKNIPTDADYITIKLGSNDATYLNQGRISIGTIDSEDVTTFYGAWNVVLMHIIDNCPNAKIGFIITGHLTEELYEAEKAIAKKYGLRTLDFASENTPYFFRQDLRKDVSAVVRQKRLEYYRVSETNIHPNDECQEFASTIIENFLRSL